MNCFVSGDAHATSCQRLVDRSVEVDESKTSIVHASSKPPLGCLSPSVPLQIKKDKINVLGVYRNAVKDKIPLF